jgi:hypothetical protein
MMSQFAREILARGKPEWFAIGRKEGKEETLTRLLQHRFGDLPLWASQKITDADLPTLEEWNLRVLDAQTLESVLADPS